MLRLRVDEALTFGFIRRPSVLLAHDLLCVLLGASTDAVGAVEGDGDGPTMRGLGVVRFGRSTVRRRGALAGRLAAAGAGEGLRLGAVS